MRHVRGVVQEARREEPSGHLPRSTDWLRKALRQQEKEGDGGAAPLGGRLLDLCLCVREHRGGLACYREVVVGLDEQGLYRAAIALCKKVLRIAPEREEVSLPAVRLGAARRRPARARNGRRRWI